jgi:hypothetical protein
LFSLILPFVFYGLSVLDLYFLIIFLVSDGLFFLFVLIISLVSYGLSFFDNKEGQAIR